MGLSQEYRKSCRLSRTVVRSRDSDGSRDDNDRRIDRKAGAGGSGGNRHAARDAGHRGVAAGERNDSPATGSGPAQRHRASGGSQQASNNSRRVQTQGGKSHTPAEVDVEIIGTRLTEHPGDVGGRARVHSDHGGGGDT